MSLYQKDSIVAIATARGIGALSIIRVSGSSLSSLFSELTCIKNIKNRYAYYKKIKGSDGKILDSVVITFFKGPHSFTGEDLFEISCHGGEVISKRIVHELIRQGCRYAHPGEFSKRAFLNGKLSLREAESINQIIHSNSELEAEKGMLGLSGPIQKSLLKAKDHLINLLAVIEHELDFVENEINETSIQEIQSQLNKTITILQKVIKGSLIGNKIQTGFRVGIVGNPNAGKSTLFNSILGYDRAITSSEKGTTRDALESFVEINGVPVVLIDTAGYWSGKDSLDALGIKKTEEIIKKADILLIVDEKNPKKFIAPFNVKEKHKIYVLSKSDLKNKKNNSKEVVSISSLKNKNIDTLLTALSTLIKSSFFKEDVFIVSSRQLILIKKACSQLEDLSIGVEGVELVERVSVIRNSTNLLEEVFGEVYNEDVLNSVFKGFCVGK